MRLSALVLSALLASPAAAQSLFDDIHAENRLAARQELARQRMLAADREALAVEARLRTAAALDTLRERRLAAQVTADVPLDPQVAAEMEAVARLHAQALAESNARILAIKPASEN